MIGATQLFTGATGILTLLLYLSTIMLAWYGLGSVRWDVFLREHKGRKASVLRLLLSIVIGYSVGQFIISYLTATFLLKSLG